MNHEFDMIIRQMKETNDRLKEMVKEVHHLNQILAVNQFLAVHEAEMKEKEDDLK